MILAYFIEKVAQAIGECVVLVLYDKGHTVCIIHGINTNVGYLLLLLCVKNCVSFYSTSPINKKPPYSTLTKKNRFTQPAVVLLLLPPGLVFAPHSTVQSVHVALYCSHVHVYDLHFPAPYCESAPYDAHGHGPPLLACR